MDRGLIYMTGDTSVMTMDQQPIDLIETTRAFWEKRLERPVSAEEAREMIANVLGYFSLLADWDSEEQKNNHTADHSQGNHSDTESVTMS
jgi:hypothetical protein